VLSYETIGNVIDAFAEDLYGDGCLPRLFPVGSASARTTLDMLARATLHVLNEMANCCDSLLVREDAGVIAASLRGAERMRREGRSVPPAAYYPYDCFRKASRSALIVSACVVGMPCGKPLYVFSVPFFSSFADNGPASAYGTI
jgi:hypothetical protein